RVQAGRQVTAGDASSARPSESVEAVGLAQEEATLLVEASPVEGAHGGVRLRVATVVEDDIGEQRHLAALLDDVEDEGEVLHHVEPLTEADAPHDLRAPGQGGEISPVASHEAGCQVLAADHRAAV